METCIVTNLHPVYRDIFIGALAEHGLEAYAKELNIDGWVRSIDVYLIYTTPEQLDTAKQIVHELQNPASEIEIPEEEWRQGGDETAEAEPR